MNVRCTVGLEGAQLMPDESAILRFLHLLEKHDLARQVLATVNGLLSAQRLMRKTETVVDATIIAAPSSTKNWDGKRDEHMHPTKKGNQWHVWIKCHIGMDADSRLVYTVLGTSANVNDVTQAADLLHAQETDVWGDEGYQGVQKREEHTGSTVNWHVAMRPGKRRALNSARGSHRLLEAVEKIKASIHAKVEQSFRVIKQKFGCTKVRYRGLVRNMARLTMLFALRIYGWCAGR